MSDQNQVSIVKTMSSLVKVGTYSRSSMQNQQNFMLWKQSKCVLSVQECSRGGGQGMASVVVGGGSVNFTIQGCAKVGIH